MLIFLYLISGLLINLILRFLDKHVTKYYFSVSTVTIGKIVYKYPLISVLLPTAVSFTLTVIFRTSETILFAIPGFTASFLAVWPIFYAPEFIPQELLKKKSKLYILCVFHILEFTIFSYAGGLIAIYELTGGMKTSKMDYSHNYWLW